MAIETLTGRAEASHKMCADEHDESNTGLPRFDIAKLTIKLTDAPKLLPNIEALSTFGTNFSDHMATVSFDPVSGWSRPEIKPYAPLMLDPASSCLHYASSVFEGMKAYLGPDGKARLFRPNMNMRRLERSVARLALPPVDGDAVLQLIKRFIVTEKRWIPNLPGYSLYFRPSVIGTRPALGVAPSDHAMLYILACPCGPYWKRPVSLLGVSDAVRAWPGGTGGHKVGGNYSPAFLPQQGAAAQGYDQILWLFGEEKRVTEAGVMNIFVVVKRADGDGLDVITPPLDGTILPGVTRDSCLALAADSAFHASTGIALHPVERAFTMFDLERWSIDGTLLEIFCVGTATLVIAVDRIGFEGRDIHLLKYSSDKSGLGPVGGALRAKISAVQNGREEYKDWGVVCE